MILHNIDQHSEAWHSIRCGRVTGTRFKNLMSKETTDSYKDLITDITCEIITGKVEESYTNALMEKGLETEPEARKTYEFEFQTLIKEIGFISPDEDSRYADWIGVSPDGLTDSEGMIEIKCPLMRTHFEYIEANKLPAEYRYQVQGQLFVTGLKYCDFVSYVEGMKLFIVRVYPDLELFAEFEKRLDILIVQVMEKISKYNKYSYDNE